MLRVRVLSDLHLEFAELEPVPAACDVLVLAGDIHQGTQGLAWARRCFPDLPIVYVPGNHEYYTHDWDVLAAELAQVAGQLGIHLLDRGTVVVGDVRFVGCTLWTDFDLFGPERRDEAMAAAAKTLFDYRHIRTAGRTLIPADTRARHSQERDWLAARLQEAGQAGAERWRATVVVTHMVPTARSTAPRYRAQLVSGGFSSHLDQLVEQADVWIHGHTHDSYDYRLGRCRVVCNPRGYRHRTQRFENGDFDEALVLTV
jgi:predicted phosphodiesterase